MTGPGLFSRSIDILGLMPDGGPSVCNIAITSRCNANCDFCNYRRDNKDGVERKFLDEKRFGEALSILHARGIRYLTITGGDPLLHRHLPDMLAEAIAMGMRPAVVTNGWLLPFQAEKLVAAGLKTVIVSIDSDKVAAHEKNRGMEGVCDRIAKANRILEGHGVKRVASVAVNRLIGDFEGLVSLVAELGFDTLTFSYPKRGELGSSSMVYSETSSLIDFSNEELVGVFEKMIALKARFPIINPSEAMREMIRHLRGEEELFPCYGGYKYFFMDWNFDVFRCDTLDQKLGSVWEFRDAPLIRDRCTACMSDCYRDSAVLLHFPVAIGDALRLLGKGRLGEAVRTLSSESNRRSIKALLEGARPLSGMTGFD